MPQSDKKLKPTSSTEAEAFLEMLHQLHYRGSLKKLQLVDLPFDKDVLYQVVEMYNRTMLEYKDTLTHLHMVDGCASKRKPFNAPPQHFIKAFDRLAEFSSLKSMDIILQCITCLHEIDPFVQKLNQTIDTLTIELENERFENERVLQTFDHTHIKPIPHIKRLKITIERLRVEDWEYIMKTFPQLTSLTICIDLDEPIPVSLDTKESYDVMYRFFDYVAKLSSYKVNANIPTITYPATLLNIQRTAHVTKLVIDDYVGDNPTTDVRLSSRNSTADKSKSQTSLYMLTSLLQQNRKPFYDYILNLMKDIDHLTIKGTTGDEDPEDEEYALACKDQVDVLALALNNLTSLKTLRAPDATITTVSSIVNSASPNRTLDLLELGPNVHSDVYLDMSMRIRHIEEFITRCNTGFAQSGSYFINMPHTTFKRINIVNSNDCVVKVSTSKDSTYHGFAADGGNPTKDDYYNWTSSENLTKVTICCASVECLIYTKRSGFFGLDDD